MLTYACTKENMVVIEPFKNFSPHTELSKQSVHIHVKLPEYNYEEVGVTYSYERQELINGPTTNRILMRRNNDKYTGTIDQLLYNTQLYYRVYVKSKGEIYLSDVYNVAERQFNIRPLENQGWILLDEEYRFHITLIGENIDPDISKYKIEENFYVQTQVVEIVELPSGQFEIQIQGRISPFTKLPYSDFPLELKYEDKIIFYKQNFKLAPPPGYGLYRLKKINSKSHAWVGGFIYNDALYAIGNGAIEKYDLDRNFWYKEQDISPLYYFYNSTSYQDGESIYFSGFEFERPNVDPHQKTVYLLKLDMTKLSVEKEFFYADVLPTLYRHGYQIRIFQCNGQEYVCIATENERSLHNTDLYRIDHKNKTLTFIQRLPSKADNVRLFGYAGKLFALDNDPLKADPHIDVYSMALYEVDTSAKTSRLLYESVGENQYPVATGQHGKDVWILGINRVFFHIDLENLVQRYMIQLTNENGVFTSDHIDHEDVQGQIFWMKNKWLFDFGFHTSGLFEFAEQHYE